MTLPVLSSWTVWGILIITLLSIIPTTEAALGDNCTEVDECVYSGATCDGGQCGCNTTGGYREEGNQCLPNVPAVNLTGPSSIVFGEDAEFTASVISDPEATDIFWQKVSGGATTNITIDGTNVVQTGTLQAGSQMLTIKSVTFDDEGTYQVMVLNSVGHTTSEQLALDVTGERPAVSVSGPTQSDTTVTIGCTAGVTSESPAITAIQWTKGSVAIDIAGSNGKYSGGSVLIPSLNITTINSTDRGDYRCKATNPVGSTTSTSAVTLAPPTVSVSGSSSVLYGNGVKYTGTVTSNLPWTAQKWQKVINNGTPQDIDINDGKYTGSSMASPNPKLEISNTDFNDEAKYQLVVSNGVGSTTSTGVTLDVTGDIPTVTITGGSSTVVFGSDITFTGTITSSPATTSVTWQKVDGSQTENLDTSNQKYLGSSVDVGSLKLVINDANFNDDAIYQLAVTNLVGNRTSNEINLTVTGEKPTITINPASATVFVVYGKTATLTATVTTTSDSPPAAVNGAWQKQMSGVFTDIDISDEKYKDSVNDVSVPVLKINSAVYTDEGAYRFTANNLVGTTVSSAKTLNVTGTKPTVSISANPSSTIQFDTTLNITATVTANPPADTARWQRKPLNDGAWSNISISDSMYNGSSDTPATPLLVIASITYREDNVAFRCVVGNVEGETNSNEITIDVTGNLASVSVTPSGPVQLPYGTTLTPALVATVTAGSNTEQAQEVRWRKITSGSEVPINISSSKYLGSTLLPNPQLVINNAIFGDEAEYQCQAKNAEGWGASNKVSVNVTGGELNVTIGSNVTGKIGESATISCTVTGPEISQISWRKGGTDITINGNKYTGSTTDSPSLTINNLVMQDADQYQCTATNPGGTYASPGNAILTVINRQFQDVCSASLPCDVSKELKCSQSKCVCKETFYHNINLCYSRDRLKVTITSHSSNTSTFTVSWTPPSHDGDLVSGYIVRWRIHDQAVSKQQSQTVDKSVTSHTVNTGLIPGQLYIVTVTSSVTLTNPASNVEVHSDQKYIRIVPLPPGSILDSSDFASDKLMLSWTLPINGTVVTKYDVTIDGTTQSTVDSNANIQFTKQLVPGTKYNVSIVTVSGPNANSNEEKRSVAYAEEIRTTPIRPGPPTGVKCPGEPKDKSLEISWTAPTAPNGRVVKYIIIVNGALTVDTLINVNTFDVTGLLEERSYTFAVKTVNDAVNSISSESVPVTCQTRLGLSTPPTALIIGTPNSRGFPVSFSVPNDVKGQLAGYRILIKDVSKCWQQINIICNSCTDFNSTSQSCDTSIVHRVPDIAVTQNYNVTGLHPYINYTVEVAAINGRGVGNSVVKTTMTEEEVPQKPSISSVVFKSDKEVELTWTLAPPSPGNVTYTVTVMEAEDNTSNVFINKREIQYSGFEHKKKVIDGLEGFWRYKFTLTATTIKGSQTSEESAVIRTKQGVPGKVRDLTVVRKPNTYRAALVQWKVPLLRDQNGILVNYRFINSGSTDKFVPVDTNELFITEEEIVVVPEMTYSIEIYAINSDDTIGEQETFIYSAESGLKQDPQSTSPVGVIVGSIAGVIIVITALVIAIFIWRRKRSESKQDSKTYADLTLHDRRSSDQTYSALDQRTRIQREKPITSQSFVDHVLDLMKDSRLKICNEFSELLQSKETAATTKANSKMNTNRNRGSVVPYDFNRVQLQEKRDGSDYINASYVLNQSYIMTQYPLPKTVGHFWRMVWEQNCPLIVALTIDDEKHKEEWYFPASDGAVRTVGGIDVELVATFNVLEKVTLRKIKLSKEKQLKNVNHIHAYGLGMVNISDQLLHSINLVAANNTNMQSNGPYVVHGGCVGIDYSGVFVVVDYLVKLIESGVNRIDVYGSTFTIMSERMEALTTEEQYTVIYTFLKRYINDKSRSGKHPSNFDIKDAASAYEYLP